MAVVAEALAPDEQAQDSTVLPNQPSQRFEQVLQVQREFMDLYGDSLEQALSALVYMVPVQEDEEGSGGDVAGFWTQVIQSVNDLFNLYRTVLLRRPEAVPVALSDSTGSNGILLRDMRRSYTVVAFSLRALRAVQVLMEMHAMRKGGAQHALRVCVRIEVVKLVMKLVLCSRMPFAFYVDEDAMEAVDPPSTGRKARTPEALEARQDSEAAIEVADQSSVAASASENQSSASTSVSQQAFVGRRSGRKLRLLSSSASTAIATPAVAYGGENGHANVDVSKLPLRISDRSRLTTRLLVAEALFHGRPLAHLLMLARRGPSSWAAWLVAVVMEHASLALLSREVRPRPGSRAAALEVAEVQRRSGIRWWALVRSPMFEKALKAPTAALDKLWKRIPLLNIFNLVEIFLALRPFYFTTSGT